MEDRISALIGAAETGDRSAGAALFSALYAELHRLAKRELARSAPVSISPTTLLHEAYLDLAKRDGPEFSRRAQFMKYASRVMRGLIIDHIRSQRAQKRGGKFELTSFDTQTIEKSVDDQELIRVSEALDELMKVDHLLAETVDLKFFCGFTFAEIAAIQGISERSAQRNWAKARVYLYQSIQSQLP